MYMNLCCRSVKDFSTQFKKKQPALHLLVNDAGVFLPPPGINNMGVEHTLAVNYYGPLLLTLLLQESLKKGARSRVVNVASITERWGEVPFGDLRCAVCCVMLCSVLCVLCALCSVLFALCSRLCVVTIATVCQMHSVIQNTAPILVQFAICGVLYCCVLCAEC
jgi:hypothetical protein